MTLSSQVERITIRKFAYLKTPKFAATYHNPQGGSFSNSGEHRTLKSVASHVWFTYRNNILLNPAMPVVIETWEGFDAQDEPVVTTIRTDVDALLARLGVTR